MKLSNAQVRVPEGDFAGSIIFSKVRQGFAPFRGKEIYVWMDFDIDYRTYTISAAVVLTNGHSISYSSSAVDAWELADSPILYAEIIGNDLFKKFRYREVPYSIPDKIELGEN